MSNEHESTLLAHGLLHEYKELAPAARRAMMRNMLNIEPGNARVAALKAMRLIEKAESEGAL